MKKQIVILGVVIIICTSLALILNLVFTLQEKNIFKIGIASTSPLRIADTKDLEEAIGIPVQLMIYPSEAELIKNLRSDQLDAYTMNPFTFIENFASTEGDRAILGIPNDYFLVTLNTTELIEMPKIGLIDEHMSSLLISSITPGHTTKEFSDPQDGLRALNDGQITHLVIPKALYDKNNHRIVEKLSFLGYSEELLILTKYWQDFDFENDYPLQQAINDSLYEALSPPDTNQLINAMTYLFNLEKLNTRYYYEDLVHQEELVH